MTRDEAASTAAQQAALIEYYSRRAGVLEEVYDRPERRAELESMAALLRRAVAGRDVLELACGTGFWTVRGAPAARSWLATDLSAAMLEEAGLKSYPAGVVRLARADALALEPEAVAPTPHAPGPQGGDGRFTAAVAGFFWSHIPRSRLSMLVNGLSARLAPDSPVLFFDNRELPGRSLPSCRRDAEGNSYQLRSLADGSRHEVMKNYPTAAELRAALPSGTTAVEILQLEHYWWLTYRTPHA